MYDSNQSLTDSLENLGIIPKENSCSSQYFFPNNFRLKKTCIINAINKNTDIKSTLIHLSDKRIKLDNELLIDWLEILGNGTIKTCLPHDIFDDLSNEADIGLAGVYCFLNLLGLAVSITALANSNPGPLLTALAGPLGIGQTWNYIDTASDTFIGINEWKKNDTTLAALNAFSSAQLMSSTLAGIIGHYVTHTISQSTALALLSFPLATCMLIATIIELIAINRLDKTIKALEEQLISAHTDKRENLNKMIELTNAKRTDHQNSALAWASCFIALIGVATVSTLGLGAPMIILATASGVSFATGAFRAWFNCYYKDKNLHQTKQNLKQSLQVEMTSFKDSKTKKANTMPDANISDALLSHI